MELKTDGVGGERADDLVFKPNHMIHERGGVGRTEQRKPIAKSAGDGFRSKAGQEIHGRLDRRRASFETTAFAASSG
jgi:hypothetical protein